jgi:glycosyltransferase involved in cell wall biosynthesis
VVRRILHISNSAYESLPEIGPSLEIFRELARGAVEYHVLGQSRSLRFSSEQEGNLHLHLVPAPSAKVFSVASYEASYLIRKHRVDGVLCQDPLLGGLAGLHSARLARIPIMIELHTDIYFRYLRSRNPALNAAGRLARHVLRRASRVRVTGETLGRSLNQIGVDPARMAYVPYRVDTNFFEAGLAEREDARRTLGVDEGLLVVSLGRFVAQKGFHQLVRAFARASSGDRPFQLLIAGGGPLHDELVTTIQEHGLAGQVRLLPWLSREQQRELLAAADLYVQPSLPGKGEWMPRTILEAMSTSLPVVASDIGGIGDVVQDGRNGTLLTPADEHALARAMQTLLDDDELRDTLGRQARRDAIDSYNWDAGFDQYRAVLYSLDAPLGAGE